MSDEIDFPAWLPSLVGEHARKVYAKAIASGSAEEVAMVMCITTLH
jgi:hypothetical protein